MIVWMGVIIAVIALDILTSAFCFSLFSIGALAAIGCSLAGFTFAVQFIVFAITGGISAVIGYPVIKKAFGKNIKKTELMEEKYIGKVYRSSENLETDSKMQMKIEGIYWTLINKGENLKKGDEFQITAIDGAKLAIKKFNKTAEN